MNESEALRKKAAERPIELRKLKENGTKIVEFTGNFVPEELIYASGAKPYLMCRGGEPEAPEAVLTDMLRFTNPLARSQCGFYKLGVDPVTPVADMIAASQYECHAERMVEYMEILGLNVHKIGVPNDWKRDFAQDYYYEQLQDFRKELAILTGKEASDEEIIRYIKLFNEINEILRKLSDLRDNDCPSLSGTEFIKLNHYSFFVDPEFAVEQLKKVYEEKLKAAACFEKDAPRLMVIGHAVAVGDYAIISKVEELGAIIAYEELEEGFRWYQWDTKTEGDPVRNIVNQRYIDKPPLNNMEPSFKLRMDNLREMIKKHRIDGVIWYQLLYDEIWDIEYSSVAKHLDDMGVPIMRIDTEYEYTREAMAPLVTRLESFIELIKMKKG